jgi:hypothetical protein
VGKQVRAAAAEMLEIAHVHAPEVERIAQEWAVELNIVMLNNRRGSVGLHSATCSPRQRSALLPMHRVTAAVIAVRCE